MLRLLLLSLLMPLTALAASQKACPPLGALPDFVPGESTLRSYDTLEVMRAGAKGGEPETFMAAGRTCVTYYALKEEKDAPSNLEILLNYRQQLEAMGAEIVSVGGRDLYAHLVKGGAESWLWVAGSETSIQTAVVEVVPPKLTILPPSGNDYRLVGHLPNFVAAKPAGKSFDSMAFEIDDDGGMKSVQAQGKTVIVYYALPEGKPALSNLEIRFNYREALRAQGAEILADAGRDLVARLMDGKTGQVIWVGVSAGETSVQVSVLEEKPFAPTIQPAPAMEVALKAAGRVTLYVNFDFDKATLRPDSAPVVAQVVAMLKSEPGLRLGVEGHTDAMGTPEHNRALSGDRAKAFVAALVAGGIGADRLVPAGFGPDKPVASNDSSEGRAKNRRVELVRM